MSRQPSGDQDTGRVTASTPGTAGQEQGNGGDDVPRWVKVFAVMGVLVVALVAVMLLSGHGPGQHIHHDLRAPVPTSVADALW